MEFYYRCSDCGRELAAKEIQYLCPHCASVSQPGEFQRGVLETVIAREHLIALARRKPFQVADWLVYALPDKGKAYPVGRTPLISPLHLQRQLGFTQLFLKNDGANPSGSLKDRASQLVAAQAIHHGQSTVVLASTGNAGSAMACAGAALGLKVLLFVPATAPKAKLLQAILYGATVIPIRGTYDEAFRLSIEYTQHFGGVNRNTAYNPLTIEGKKTVALEIYMQLGGQAPDIVFIPVGDGVIYAGVYKGFSDLQAAGLIEKLPQLVVVQAEGSNAIAQAYRTGQYRALQRANTGADSIAVASPANGRLAIKYLRASAGWCVEVSEAEIAAAQLQLTHEAGIFCEPAAAAVWAGFIKETKKLDPNKKIVVLLTGIGFKDLASAEKLVQIPVAIEPNLKEVIRQCPFLVK